MNKHNTIGKGSTSRAVNGGSDTYYTKQYIADFYSHIVYEKYGSDYSYVEPTAGNGAFLRVIPGIIGYDLHPQDSSIIEMDVFNLKVDSNTIVIGNPPFGMNASTAIKVFNHLAQQQVKAICFIVPKSFKKTSVQNKLNKYYRLVFEDNVLNNAFLINGTKEHNVPCCFQIWEVSSKARKIKEEVSQSPWFSFSTPDDYDIAVRRAGGKAGQVITSVNPSKSSTYFLKIHHPDVLKAIRVIDLSVVNHTAGVRSISKPELCNAIDTVMEKLNA